MGKRSTKANKNIYQQCRESLNLTRAEASNRLEVLSESRISRIESGDFKPYPDEILIMADKYQKPELCNYYCTKECSIGQFHVPEIHNMTLSEITVSILGNLQTLEKTKTRLVDITIDGTIDDSEISDFIEIQSNLKSLSAIADSLQLWIANAINTGKIDKSKFPK